MLQRLFFVCFATLALPARAVIGAADDAPAATLLIPYVELDTTKDGGRSTVVEVRNTESTATMTRVTVWTDQGVPVLGFDAYLTGYDTYSFDLRDVLAGRLPVTASNGQDRADTISNQGPRSQDINFASCNDRLPSAPLPAATVEAVKLALTGRASPVLDGRCGGRDLGDGVARGFITIDVTTQCTDLMPGMEGYFGGVAHNRNQLTGRFQLVHPSTRTAHSLTAVHLEASHTGSHLEGPQPYTFYSRLTGGLSN